MNKISQLIAVVLVLTVLSLPVLGEMNGGRSDGSGMDTGKTDSGKNDSSMMDSSNRNDNSMHEKAKEMYDNGSRMRDEEDMMGMEFMHKGDDSYGGYVTFSVNNSTGDVLNFGILGIAIFDSLKIPGFDFKGTRTEGAETKIVNKDGSIVVQLHDNPAAVINIKTDTKATLIFNLASGVSAAKQDNIIKIMAGNLTAYIASEKATAINIAGNQVTINTDKGLTIFRASPINMPHDDMEEQFMGEMMTNRRGAEVSVGESDKYSIVNYSENMTVIMESIEPNHMRMMIDSSDHTGKFVLMNIDNSSLMWNDRERVRLYLDNKPMKEVMTEQELYRASESSFWLNMIGTNRMQAMMYIANFSTRQVDVVVEGDVTPTPMETTVAETTAPPTPSTPGFEIALGGLCTVAAAYIMRRRR